MQKEGYSWEDVFKMLEKFVREKMKKDRDDDEVDY